MGSLDCLQEQNPACRAGTIGVLVASGPLFEGRSTDCVIEMLTTLPQDSTDLARRGRS